MRVHDSSAFSFVGEKVVILLKNIIEMDKIIKVYPNGVMANNGADFNVSHGEIHALVGENGAGKTTLMKILFGIERATSGSIRIEGKDVRIGSVAEALELGLGMVQQHFMLVPSMTAAENIVLGQEPQKRLFLDKEKAVELTQQMCQKYSFNLDVNAKVKDMAVGDRQKVEILKALYRKAQVLILDEPTAVLTPQETEELFRQLTILKQQGHTVVFISHKLREVEALCDRVTIMRNAQTVGTYALKDISTEQISEYMMGRHITLNLNKSPASPKEALLEIEDLTYITAEGKKVLEEVGFSLRGGEVLGLVGVEGNGQKELVDMVSGLRNPSSGRITICGTDTYGKSVREIRGLSVALIPQERMEMGVSLECSVTENMSSVTYRSRRNQLGPFLKWKKLAAMTRKKMVEYTIKSDSEKTKIRMLSGGNIQKVVVAREFADSPVIIIADQPTRGIDVGAAHLIHKKLIELRDCGSAVLLISSDLNEVMSVCDSIIVMYSGKISAYFPETENLEESELGLYMLGVETQPEEQIRRCRHEDVKLSL